MMQIGWYYDNDIESEFRFCKLIGFSVIILSENIFGIMLFFLTMTTVK